MIKRNLTTPGEHAKVKAAFFDAVRNTAPYLRQEQYDKTVAAILAEKNKSVLYDVHKTQRHYLIQKRKADTDPVVKYMSLDEYFSVIFKLHLRINHLKELSLYRRVKNMYPDFSIPQTFVNIIVSCCNVCKSKKGVRRLKYRADNQQYINETIAIHIHDMRDNSDGNFRYLIICKDECSSYVWLRPLMNKSRLEIASEIAKIWYSFGAPQKISVQPSELELFSEVLYDLKRLCGERNVLLLKNALSNNIWFAKIKNRVLNWISDTGSNRWSVGCRVVQLKLNNGIKFLESTEQETPYQRMFNHSNLTTSNKRRDEDNSTTVVDIDQDDDESNRIPIIEDSELSSSDVALYVGDQNQIRSTEMDNVELDVVTLEENGQNNVEECADVRAKLLKQICSEFQIIVNESNTDSDNETFPSEMHLEQKEKCPNKVTESKLIDNIDLDVIILEERVKNGQRTSAEGHAELVKEICRELQIEVKKSNASQNDTGISILQGSKESIGEQTVCNVCHSFLLKSFLCRDCCKPVHLYCGVQFKENRTSLTVCFNCVGQRAANTKGS